MSIRGLGLGVSGVVPGFGVPRLLWPARAAVLLTLFAAGLLLAGLTSSAFGTVGGLPTPGAGLPDGRIYEMVSPPAKNGGDILANSQRTRAAADGSAVMFASLTPFGDALGTGVATEYIAQRAQSANPGSNGWETHAVTPPQTPESFLAAGNASEAAYQGEVSADLTKGAIRTFSPLTDAPNVAVAQNLYLRSDLRSPGPGAYTLLSDCLAPPDGPCVQPLPDPYPSIFGPTLGNRFPLLTAYRPWLAGASASFNQVIYEDAFTLTDDAPGALDFSSIFKPKLYESDHGVTSYVGLVPPPGQTECTGAACQPAASSVAGQGAAAAPIPRYTPHTISADGSRIFFTANPTGCTTTLFVCGELYMRSNNGTPSATSVQLNASERTVPDPNHATATYWDASTDGSRVFFVTQEALTDDAPLDTSDKLYMYDASLPGSDPHNLTLLNRAEAGDNAEAIGVIGASDDGHYVYFVNDGQLVAGKPLLDTNPGVFLWHNGAVSFVGQLGGGPSDAFFDDVSNTRNVLTFSPKQARVSADGRTLLFSSTAGDGMLSPPYDQGGHHELYVYRADTGQLSCASCKPSGATGTSDASTIVRTRSGGSSTTTHLNHAISDDGRYVFFSTAEPLVPADSNGKSDAYEYDTLTGTVSLLSSGKDPADSYFLDASASGDDAFILTRERLSKWDTDQNYDVYDVRLPHPGHPAGFPDPPPTSPGCEGEGCQGALTLPPSGPNIGSSLLTTGTGNAVPVSKERSKSLSKSQKLKQVLKACKSKRSKAKRKKCESAARRRFGKSGGSR